MADAYLAMTTDPPYRAALDVREAMETLVEGSGTQFDPDLVPTFVACLTPERAALSA